MSGVYFDLASTDVAQRIMNPSATFRTSRTAALSAYGAYGANSQPQRTSASTFGPAVITTFSRESNYRGCGAYLVSRAGEEAIAEAKRRMEDGPQVTGLPMTEENKKLYDELSKEMNQIDLYANPWSTEYNQLFLMQKELEEHGWNEPLTREDLAFEVEVRDYTLGSQLLSGELDPLLEIITGHGDNPDEFQRIADDFDMKQPLPSRWAENGLNMPPRPRGVNQWELIDMAQAAGISAKDFRAAALEQSKTLQGADLYYALEQMISDSYAAMLG
ncbi:MAG: hypothetical protein LBV80_07625 [Deltaproteobacteria bacterium]|jgi:hypothetical protein|nr:hypothetical protein [Deltaproteobacteria bacterium]